VESQLGAASGVATLDGTINVPVGQLGAVPGIIAAQSPVVMAGEPSGGDDTTALNALLTVGAGKTVMLKAGRTYIVTNTLTVPTKTTVDMNGATIDARTMPVATVFRERPVFLSIGTTAASVAISSAIARWSNTASGISSTASFSADDLVVVYNQEQPVPGMTRTDRDKGELRFIKTVDSSTAVTFATGSIHDYSTNGLTIFKVNPVENVTIKNGKIIMGGTGSRHNAIRVEYGRNITVENMNIDGSEQCGIDFSAVINGRIRANTIAHCVDEFVGYGIVLMDGSTSITVENNFLRDCKHLIAGGGRWPATHINVVNNRGIGMPGYAAFECHEPTFYWKFNGNILRDVGNGFLIRGQYITVENNEVTNASQQAYKADTWDHVTEQRGLRFINNSARNAILGGLWAEGLPDAGWTDAGYTTDPNGAYKDINAPCLKIDLEVIGNSFTNCGSNPVLVRHFAGAVLDGNTVTGGSSSDQITCLGLDAATASTSLVLGDNKSLNSAASGIKAQYVDGITGTGGRVENAAKHGIELQTCNRTNLSGPSVFTPGQAGIFIVGGSRHSITGAAVSGGTNSGYDAVRVSASADVSISGGMMSSARYAVYTTTTDNVVATGIHMKGAANVARYSIDATNKVVANNLV